MAVLTANSKNDRYGAYLDKEYNQQQKPVRQDAYNPVRGATGKSVYDIQRERVASDTEAQSQKYQEALKRRMAQQGVQQSGVNEKATRNLNVEMAKARAMGMSEIDVNELTAIDQDRQAREARDFALKERLGQQAFQAEQVGKQQGFQAGESALGREQEKYLQGQQLGLQRELALSDLSLKESQLAETARQFNTEDEFKRYALNQNMSESEAARAWQANQSSLDRAQKGELTYADLSLRESELAQQASQFTDELGFKQWATQAGLDDQTSQRVWQAQQNSLERQQRGELTYADLGLQEKQLAQQASQFKDEISYKQWATRAGIDDNQAARAWQAAENYTQLLQNKQIAMAELSQRDREIASQAQQFQSEIDFKKWSTQAGIDNETASRAWQANQNSLDREQKGQLTMADLSLREQELTQQAAQFGDEISFKRWATQAGFDENSSNRTWQAFQNSLDREQKGELSYADLSVRSQELAQQSQQFNDELRFKQWSTQQGYSEAESARAWQAGQNALEREQKGQLFYADLSQQDKELSLQASQFGDELSFKRWATQSGLDDAAASRAWQAAENQTAHTRGLEVLSKEAMYSMENLNAETAAQMQLMDKGLVADLGKLQQQYENAAALGMQESGQQMNMLLTQMKNDKWMLQTKAALDYNNASSLQNEDAFNKMQQLNTQLAETGRQFDISTGVERDKLAQDLQMLQAQIGQQQWAITTQAQLDLSNSKELKGVDQLNQLGIIDQNFQNQLTAMQTAAGIDTNQMYTASNLKQVENLQTYGFQTGLNQQNADNAIKQIEASGKTQQELAAAKANLEKDLLDAQLIASQKSQMDKYISDSFYTRGINGEVLSEAELSKLSTDNPLAYSAYLAGKSGKTLQEYEDQRLYNEKYINARIENMSDLTGATFEGALEELYGEMGIKPDGERLDSDDSQEEPTYAGYDAESVRKLDDLGLRWGENHQTRYDTMVNAATDANGMMNISKLQSSNNNAWVSQSYYKAYTNPTSTVYDPDFYKNNIGNFIQKPGGGAAYLAGITSYGDPVFIDSFNSDGYKTPMTADSIKNTI